MTIDAGKLREPLELMQPTRTKDAVGGTAVEWNLLADVWGEVVGAGGGETFDGVQVSAETTHVVTIRHRTDVTTDMRFNWDSRVLEILSLSDPDGRREFLILQCVEHV